MKKDKKGITLIALIITIIVMLILVGVTVTTAINGGLFESARRAATKTQIEVDKEKLSSALVAAYNEKTGEINKNKLENALGAEWYVGGVNPGPYMCKNNTTNNKLIVTAEGEITEEDKLVVSYKIIDNGYSDKEKQYEKTLYLMIESGFDYEKEFCNIVANESEGKTFNSTNEALKYMYEKQSGKEGSDEEIKEWCNKELFGIDKEEDYFTTEQFIKFFVLSQKVEKREVKISENGEEDDDTMSCVIGLWGDSEDKIDKKVIEVTFGEKHWKCTVGD